MIRLAEINNHGSFLVWLFFDSVYVCRDDFISQPSLIARLQEERPSLAVRISITILLSQPMTVIVCLKHICYLGLALINLCMIWNLCKSIVYIFDFTKNTYIIQYYWS